MWLYCLWFNGFLDPCSDKQRLTCRAADASHRCQSGTRRWRSRAESARCGATRNCLRHFRSFESAPLRTRGSSSSALLLRAWKYVINNKNIVLDRFHLPRPRISANSSHSLNLHSWDLFIPAAHIYQPTTLSDETVSLLCCFDKHSAVRSLTHSRIRLNWVTFFLTMIEKFSK